MSEMTPLPHPVTNMQVGDDWEDVFVTDQLLAYGDARAAAEIRALHAQREALTQEVARLREALVNAALPLEVLYAVEQQVPTQAISQSLKDKIRDAVHTTRYALGVKS